MLTNVLVVLIPKKVLLNVMNVKKVTSNTKENVTKFLMRKTKIMKLKNNLIKILKENKNMLTEIMDLIVITIKKNTLVDTNVLLAMLLEFVLVVSNLKPDSP